MSAAKSQYHIDSAAGRVVRDSIVPMVARLAHVCPIDMRRIVPRSALRALNVSESVLCSNLASSDQVFDHLRFK